MKTKVIIIRGCKFRLPIEQAKQLEKSERELIRNDMNKNNLLE